jgi:nucleoside-diphosphate-sugar epimerase
MRLIKVLRGRYRIFGLARSADLCARLREQDAVMLRGDLDIPDSLRRIASVAQDVVHFAPPPAHGEHDTRTANLIHALSKGASLPQRFVYISTSGVYGDCGGLSIDETRTPNPLSARGMRRLDAEKQLRAWGANSGVHVIVLRVPGIYAANRLPLERLRANTPVIEAGRDAYTNHIHADDLARIVVAALLRGRAGRAYHAVDDSELKMGDYFDLVANEFGLPRPPRVSWDEAVSKLSENLLSFARESRRLRNGRMKSELRVKLAYPQVARALHAIAQSHLRDVAARGV